MALMEWGTAASGAGFQTTPQPTDSRRDGDDRIRELKEQISLRLLRGNHVCCDSTEADDGKHVVGPASPPDLADGTGGEAFQPYGDPGSFKIYKADKSTPAVTITDTSCTMGTNVVLYDKDGNIISGSTGPGGGTARQRSVSFHVGGILVLTGTTIGDSIIPPIECAFLDTGETATIVAVRAVVLKPSVGADIEFDVRRCPALSNPIDGNLTSILPGGTPMAIPEQQYKAATLGPFTPAELGPNDILTLYITQLGTSTPGSNLVVTVVLSF